MKIVLNFVLLLLLISFSRAKSIAADEIPKRPDFARYSAMLDRSPFALATAVVMPAATPNFAKDLYVANAARATGEDLVTVQSSGDKAFKEYLSTKGPNDHGYAIANIEWSDRPGATKVTISKDGQFANLTFNQALIAQVPPPNAAAPAPIPGSAVPPGVPTPVPSYVPSKPGNPSGYPTPPTHVRGVIQRNPNAPVLPKPSVGNQNADEQ